MTSVNSIPFIHSRYTDRGGAIATYIDDGYKESMSVSSLRVGAIQCRP